jgi:phosphoribosyl-AMP cyclohydrolase
VNTANPQTGMPPTDTWPAWIAHVRWDANGLIPVIAQDAGDGQILMFAWMNREALQRTVASGQAVYWSRSRNRLWHKGEESGHFQNVKSLRLDCDEDVLLLRVEQVGDIACHTGRRHCFFQLLSTAGDAPEWQVVEPVAKPASQIYQGSHK